MGYLVLARKWRPQQFDQVVGQNHVTRTLQNAIDLGRVAHAYLFCGPRGVGKTTTARIFAKALNCQKGMKKEPCDACSNCKEISAGTSLDVLEIDGASNRGIDQVRELRDNVKFAPASSRFKIYIIDEVHMLTTEAFNALLKTLEEPPEHVKFFFATTEPHKVPSTILSRCQRFDLRKISAKEIYDALKNIVRHEKIKTEEKTLFAVAKAADGSLRDAESLLDQLISFSQGDLRYEDALNILGWISMDAVIHFLELVKKGDWKGLFSLIRDLDHEGKDAVVFVRELTSYLRDLMLLQASPEEKDLVELTPEDDEKARAQSRMFSKDQFLQMLEISLDAEDRIKFSVSKRSALEALTVRLYLISQSVSLESLISRMEALGSHTLASESLSGGGSTSPEPRASHQETGEVKKATSQAATEKKGDLKKNDFLAEWGRLLEDFSKNKPLLHAYLKDAVPSLEDNKLILLFPPEKSFFLDSLKAPDLDKLLRSEIKNIFGAGTFLELKLLASDPLKESDLKRGLEGSASQAAPFLQDDPVVQKALEMFGGKITEIKIKNNPKS